MIHTEICAAPCVSGGIIAGRSRTPGARGIFLLYEPTRRFDEDRAAYLDRAFNLCRAISHSMSGGNKRYSMHCSRIVIARLRIGFTRSVRILHRSRPVVIVADTRPGAPEIMFGIEHMGLPVGQSAESLGEVRKFALGYACAAPVGMLLAGLFDKAVRP
jgi:hypothetical protein